MYSTRNTNKQKKLLQQDRRIFKTSDLAVLWEIENKATLWQTITRYTQRSILHPIHKGLYSVVPLDKLHRYEIGCAICGQYSYVSLETVLENEGLIMQNINKVTLLGKKAKEITINNITFLCKYLNEDYLLNREGINDDLRFSIATKVRALADISHVKPNYFIDNRLAIDQEKVDNLKRKIGYK